LLSSLTHSLFSISLASLPVEGEKEEEFIKWRDLSQKISMVASANSKKSKHAPLMLRQKEETLEEKVMNLGDKKKKLYDAKIGKREAATTMEIDEGEDYDE
jgi:hypothetical protein